MAKEFEEELELMTEMVQNLVEAWAEANNKANMLSLSATIEKKPWIVYVLEEANKTILEYFLERTLERTLLIKRQIDNEHIEKEMEEITNIVRKTIINALQESEENITIGINLDENGE